MGDENLQLAQSSQPSQLQIEQLTAENGRLREESARAWARELELEEQLRFSRAEFNAFVHTISHDLKEPLRKVEAFGARLETALAAQLDEKHSDYLARMRRAARRMDGYLEGLLLLSRVTTRGAAFQAVDLNDVAFQVKEKYEAVLKGCDARFVSENLPVVNADPLQMCQLLRNLLSNSLRFRREGVMPLISLCGWQNETHCGFSMKDNGRGFGESAAARIFDIFAGLETKECAPSENLGVGLAVCRKIVERHGGTIRAQGKVGEGAEFQVELPRPHAGLSSR